MTDPLLHVDALKTHIETDEGTVRAVDGVSFSVDRGETVCLVGESGSGKTVTCESLARLVPSPPAELVGGTITFDGEDLTAASERELRDIRGRRIGHVFQNAHDALDPVYTVGDQIIEAIEDNTDVRGEAAEARAVELLDRVGIPNPARRMDEYPHEFSGGMNQRAVIALALAADPDLLIADEPTTALDVTIEAQILDLLADIQAERDMAVLFVTHDLGVVAEIADRVVVMYGGKVMERGGVHDLFETPSHPYTRALLDCLPGQGTAPEPIGGSLPDPTDPPDGCRFAPRCPHAVYECREGDHPPAHEVGDGHEAACVYYDGERDPSVVRGDDAPGAAADGGPEADGDPGGTGDAGAAPGGDAR